MPDSRTRRVVPMLVVVSVAIAAPAPDGRQVDPQSLAGPVFQSRTDLVALHVTVIDHQHAVLGRLPAEAFAIYEDGVRQTITQFNSDDLPLAVGLVIDNSTSMLTRRDMVVDAGLAFADASRPDDQLFTINFNERVWRGLPPTVPFTSSRALLHMALRNVRADGRTALFDAVAAALDQMQQAPLDRRILIVLSDGGDNASRTSVEALLARAQHSDVVIYAVGLVDEYTRDANPGVLRRLAKATGGDALFPTRESDVVTTFAAVAREVRRGYTLGYVSTDTSRDGRFRRLRVEVRAPGHDHLTVRAREGYRASSGSEVP